MAKTSPLWVKSRHNLQVSDACLTDETLRPRILFRQRTSAKSIQAAISLCEIQQSISEKAHAPYDEICIGKITIGRVRPFFGSYRERLITITPTVGSHARHEPLPLVFRRSFHKPHSSGNAAVAFGKLRQIKGAAFSWSASGPFPFAFLPWRDLTNIPFHRHRHLARVSNSGLGPKY